MESIGIHWNLMESIEIYWNLCILSCLGAAESNHSQTSWNLGHGEACTAELRGLLLVAPVHVPWQGKSGGC